MKVYVGGNYRTRDGRKVQVLRTDVKNTSFPVLALVSDKNGAEYPQPYRSEGSSPYCATLNIVAASEDFEITGWVNVYPRSYLDPTVYLSEIAAMQSAGKNAVTVSFTVRGTTLLQED